MKYKRDLYSKLWLIISGIVIVGFLYQLGLNAFTPGNVIKFQFTWLSILWFVMGGIILIRYLLVIANRSKLRKIVLSEFEIKPNISVEKISVNTGITKEDVSLIILDLKTNGRLGGDFSSSTGEAKSMKVITQEQETGVYCQYCGTPINSEEATFCGYCGTKL